MFGKLELPLRKDLLNNLVFDYLNKDAKTEEFYSFFPDISGFAQAIDQISNRTFNREILTETLLLQAQEVSNTSAASVGSIKKISNTKTYTITTGHQLCLFTGPLYFIYKIFSVINLTEKLKAEFPEYDFVPVYWMASEDHDIEEINHFNLFGKQIKWNTNQTGAAGNLKTESLLECLIELKNILGKNSNADELISLFEKSYLKQSNLALATRFLVNEIFGKYGLVIVDGNCKELKRTFSGYFEKDIFGNLPFSQVSKSIEKLKMKSYPVQVNPRPINCFYLQEQSRERIEKSDNGFKVVNTEVKWNDEELKSIIANHPEKISPNVVLRPCYQQSILPNLAYVGGPGELAYWLEYKNMMEEMDLFFPVLVPRKFVTIIDKNNIEKLNKLKMEKEMIFENADELIKIYLERNNQAFNLDEYKKNLSGIFEKLNHEISKIDKSLVAAADAEKQRNLNSFENLEQKVTRSVKSKMETEINQIKSIRLKYFPDGIPQERVENFSTYYSKWGNEFLNALKENLTYDLKENSLNIIFEN